ncbi:hypothetical protein J9303_20910, partial [Bacillaceae bacterium Marseille-Q3522]|nr:hypothetical protein [Bacillaceae bacterium Marseille-Q3522]
MYQNEEIMRIKKAIPFTFGLKLWLILLLVSGISFLISSIKLNSSSSLNTLWLLPLTHFLSILICRSVFKKESGISLVMIQMVMACRYSILPILFAFDEYYTGVTVPGVDLQAAIGYMVYELLVVTLCIYTFTKLKIKKGIVDNKDKIKSEGTSKGILRYFTIFSIVYWLYIVLTSSKLRGRLLNFNIEINDTGLSTNEYMADVSGSEKIFFNIGLIVIFVVLLK